MTWDAAVERFRRRCAAAGLAVRAEADGDRILLRAQRDNAELRLARGVERELRLRDEDAQRIMVAISHGPPEGPPAGFLTLYSSGTDDDAELDEAVDYGLELMQSTRATYWLRYFFDMGCCLWIGNEAARERWDAGPVDDRVGLSEATQERMARMSAWFDGYMNPDYPPDATLWSQDECDRFNAASRELLRDLRRELGSDFEIIDEQPTLKTG